MLLKFYELYIRCKSMSGVGIMQSICLIVLLFVELAVGLTELDILLELRKGIQEDSSHTVVFGSWNPDSVASDGCPKDWYGITCANGHVTSVMLNDLGLSGDFNLGAISGLRRLVNLSICNNFFAGTIPEEVGLIESLEYLDLHSNDFTGEVTSLLSRLGGSVNYVDVSNNGLSGTLDMQLGYSSFVSAVRYFNISHNNLTGEIFSHDSMPYFDNLEVFDASHNQFVGNVPSFNFVVSLRILRLRGNQLSGALPEALFQESSMILSELDVSLNHLEGPVGIITSTTLRDLNLSYNKLLGLLPAKIGHCAIIDFSHNMFYGNLSRIQGWGNYVESIDLSSNSLAGTWPNETSEFLRLTSIKISNNSIAGVLPPVLGTYPNLETIDFSLNKFNGTLLPTLFNSTRLTDLNLSFNNFLGAIPIETLNITSSSESTQNLSLISLDLSHNALAGLLPPDIGNFQNMAYLDLSYNDFEGVIPDNLPDELEGFNVSFNNFSGPVPDNLRRFPDSAFHPGNYFLIFPHSSRAPGAPDLSVRHGSVRKVFFRAALIAGLVTGVSLALLAFLIYYRTHLLDVGRNHSKGNVTNKDNQRGISYLPGATALNKDVTLSLTSRSFPEDINSSSLVGSTCKHIGSVSTVQQQTKDPELPESMRKTEEISPPMSIISMAIPSSSKGNCTEMPDFLKSPSQHTLTGDLHLFNSSLIFTAKELSCAPAEVIGRSCHGTLYKATLYSGQLLAVKWLKEGIAKGRNEFARESKKLASIKHENLISLQGYYWGPSEYEKLLITNYVDAPCLALYLHETAPRVLPLLTLDERLKIAVDVAHCLNYLHNERAIPHGNLKSTNILLEGPKLHTLLSDYSLHRLLTSAGTAEQVLNAGALGYRPPEFCSTSKPCPSLKSDVYAFGVILLELLTGKSSAQTVTVNTGALDLTEWVRLLYTENRSVLCFDRYIVECNIEGLPKGLDDMLLVALRCILPADERPDMKSVSEILSFIALHH